MGGGRMRESRTEAWLHPEQGAPEQAAVPWSAPFHPLSSGGDTGRTGEPRSPRERERSLGTGPSGGRHGPTGLGWWLQAALSLPRGLAS